MGAQLASYAAKLKFASLAALPDLVRQWLPGGEIRGDSYVALNPRRDDRSLGSFQINVRTGQWRDHTIGRGGKDVVSLFAYLRTGDNYRAALKELARDPLVRAGMATGAGATLAKAANTANLPNAKQARVLCIYANAVGLCGMPAAKYLHSRGLRRMDAWDRLRASEQYYPRSGRYPVLIAPIDDPNGCLTGLQRTFLRQDGTKLNVPNPRLSLGRVHGCAIRIGEATDELIICEGLEDGLSLHQELEGKAVWVAGGAGFLPSMAIPESVRRLTIAADNDEVGELAARRAADVFSAGGREVRIMRPAEAFKDFNDQLRGLRRG